MENNTKNATLVEYGITNLENVYWNLSSSELYEHAIRRGEGQLAADGPLVVRTGSHTGRSPNDKFLVKEDTTENDVYWSKDSKAMTEDQFDRLYNRMCAYLQNKEIFVQECYAGAEPETQLKVRVINEFAWHNMFARNMFIREEDRSKLEGFVADFTVINAPRFNAIPEIDGTNSETFIILNFKRKLVIIGGTAYAGETKKSIFSVLNYILPKKGILSMHCSANVGKDGDVALFFGLSGTGKTTLSTDPNRALIGDDEHGWSDKGVFNFEGGCYAKVINLSAEAEPDIYATTQRFGTVLENVVMDPTTRKIDLNDGSLTENTRASYPITHMPNIVDCGYAGEPDNIVFLTYDAFGVLPPVARLSEEQAMYHFVSGYTAKVAGTERGIKEPVAAFSACFGAPFMVHHPAVYAKLLADKIKKRGAKCWLLNTGLTGGPYGVGTRYKIKHTRAIIDAILGGKLDTIEFNADAVFGFGIPATIPGVPTEILDPKAGWTDKAAYDAKLKELANKFKTNFTKFEMTPLMEEVAKGGPTI